MSAHVNPNMFSGSHAHVLVLDFFFKTFSCMWLISKIMWTHFQEFHYVGLRFVRHNGCSEQCM